jgi:zinc transporter 1/2/3
MLMFVCISVLDAIMDGTQLVKIIVLFTLLISTFLFSMLPLKLFRVTQSQLDRERRKRYKSIMSLLSCFAAGVFLATCLMDLFPDVQDNLKEVMSSSGISTKYPVAEFVMLFGMFLILIIEQLVLTIKDQQRSGIYQPLLSGQGDVMSTSVQSEASMLSDSENEMEVSVVESEIAEEEVQERTEAYEDPSSHSMIRSIILLLALSLHSLFEGLAVGLQSTKEEVIKIFIALAIHKSILAFSLGLNLVQSKFTARAIIKSNLFFSVTSPTGIALGIIINLFSHNKHITLLVDGILEGLACGTFVYVVFFEILPHEFMTKRRYPARMLKVLFLIFGFAAIAALLILDPENQSKKVEVPATDSPQTDGFSLYLRG